MNSNCYIYDGEIRDEFSISPNSSSHLFGGSVFTSLRSIDGCFLCIKDHLERIVLGVKYFWPWISSDKLFLNLESNLAIAKKVVESSDYYLRISCWIEMESPNITMDRGEAKLLFTLNKIEGSFLNSGVKLLTAKIKRESPFPSYVKGGNLLAASSQLRDTRAKGFDDLLFIREDGSISECSTSNLFFYKNGTFFTAEISSDVLDGVIRRSFINYLSNRNRLEIGTFNLEELLKSDGVLISNSVKGISTVSKVNETTFSTVQELEQVITSFANNLE